MHMCAEFDVESGAYQNHALSADERLHIASMHLCIGLNVESGAYENNANSADEYLLIAVMSNAGAGNRAGITNAVDERGHDAASTYQ